MSTKIPFDQYQRYRMASMIIDEIREGNETFKILEVGANEHKNLELFLREDSITYLDIVVPEHLKNDSSYIEGDATSMPFVDGAYDFVIALDVYEHIPAALREKFLYQIDRVANRGFILAAPFNTEGVQEAELRANSFFKTIYGMDYQWLQEHIENTLPELDSTLRYLNKSKSKNIMSYSHGSLAIWERMTKVHFFAAGKNVLYDYRFLLDEFYNKYMFVNDFVGPCYRSFILGISDEKVMNELRGKLELQQSNSNEDMIKFSQLEESFYRLASLESRTEINSLYENIKMKDNEIKTSQNLILEKNQKFEAELLALVEQNKSLNSVVYEKELKCQEQNEIINQKESKISELLSHTNALNGEVLQQKESIEKLEMQQESNQRLIRDINQMLMENKQAHEEKLHQLELKNREIENFQKHIINLEKISQEMRIKNRIKKLFLKPYKYMNKSLGLLKLVRSNPSYVNKGIDVLKKNGVKALLDRVDSVQHNPTTTIDETALKSEILNFQKKPMISIVMPVYNVSSHWLSLAIQSVEDQVYTNWQLCIADDGSSNMETIAYLKTIDNPKIKIVFLEKNEGISGSSNQAVNLADGDYIVLLDNDDEFLPDTVFEIVKSINLADPDFIYSDEDKIDKNGFRKFPFMKPDWSPDLLRSQMYIGHIFSFKKSLFYEVGGFRKGFEGAQDYDLALRMTEKTQKIHHIPKILYSWREIDSSTALNPSSKPYAHEAGIKALNEHLERVNGLGKAWAEETDNLFVYKARYKLNGEPMVSIIIPTKDKIELLQTCIESIINKTTYTQYEIIILNNNSEEEETYRWFDEICKQYKFIRVIEAFYEFNWSKLNNHGIDVASGEIYVFLNNDTIVITHDWLQRLAENALRQDVGTVGALLLYEDETIQHAGVVVGMGGWADHVFKGMKAIHFGSPFVSPVITRNVLASTGACLAISKNTINKIGNFDENFIICGSDVEISLRAYKLGLFNIFDPHVKLFHLESKTRSAFVPECDFQQSAIHYSPYREQGDPFYNINLSKDSPKPQIRERF